MGYLEEYKKWLSDPIFDADTKSELEAIKDNDEEIKDRFYRDLEFGTGGLRGVIGAGTNRMNLYTVRRATQGLSNYIIKNGTQKQGVAIAFDCRHMSVEFSEAAALVLAANGIKAYLFDSLRPTPELSFALRTLNCTAGIVVTASHNPPEYNGYKVYWADGAQITSPRDHEIIDEVEAVADFGKIKTMSRKEAEDKGLLQIIGSEIDDKYIDTIKKLTLNPEIIKEEADDLKIVYTPLHGTGNVPVQRVLRELGYKNVWVVPEQEKPDGDFPTVSYPNPEDANAFKLALALGIKKDADVVLATDPDADRLGVYAKDSKTGEYHSFTGNMSGMLICEYVLSQRQEKGLLHKDGVLVKTIVSTNMADKIAAEYNIALREVLTGFKYIGEQIKFMEENHDGHYEFGFEESYGCLVGTHARDKDAPTAVMMLCEAAAFYKKQGLSLWDQMLNIYEKYGYFRESLQTLTFKGIEGAQKIKSMMENIRSNPPKKLGVNNVKAFRDYEKNTVLDIATGKVSETGLPKSNVLYFDLDDDAWICVRPSGTEPKIKFYIGTKGSSFDSAQEKNKVLTAAFMELAK
jgi:phosphoglucomutase